ncbi:hypothetical protein K461DRAFT_280076 [Myriangium duriaei CBS 260.36]|uniref:Uncharacterized protein n=1 Tax=Myriangium duriaei CBS 260.36 TaxID=1168546 RepID=A0A9P4IWM2_9PEZI|nr:hypothetical protein K461DRAFT_280076 [Myriangium duriaei CBS 260.36]
MKYSICHQKICRNNSKNWTAPWKLTTKATKRTSPSLKKAKKTKTLTNQFDEAQKNIKLQKDLALLETFDREDPTPVTFDAAEISRNELMYSGRGSATIAGANYEGVIQDRIKMLTDTTTDNTRWAPELAKKMMRGGLVSFNSEKEKGEVVEAAKEYAHKLGRSASNARKGLPDVISEYEFAPLTERMQASITDRYIRGKHVNLAAKPHKSEVLNHIRTSLFRNNTYLARDGAVFMRKVEDMLAGSKPAGNKSAPKKQGKPAAIKK